jgi:hypothetical protein
MCALGEVGKVLPRAIPAAELQRMLKSDQAFSSWDPTTSTINDSTTGWPYLFAHPNATTEKKLTQ